MFHAFNLTGFADRGRLRLAAALAGSFAFHALVIGGAHLIGARTRPAAETPAPLQATLLAPPPSPAAPILPASQAPEASTAEMPAHLFAPPRRGDDGAFQMSNAAAQAVRQVARDLPYPPEAIARGLEGEALVTLFLDDAGNAIAARLERTSGHALLDDAAVKAARGVRALPGATPREMLLPVRFRLH